MKQKRVHALRVAGEATRDLVLRDVVEQHLRVISPGSHDLVVGAGGEHEVRLSAAVRDGVHDGVSGLVRRVGELRSPRRHRLLRAQVGGKGALGTRLEVLLRALCHLGEHLVGDLVFLGVRGVMWHHLHFHRWSFRSGDGRCLDTTIHREREGVLCQRLARFITLLGETSDDAARRLVLVERLTELLTHRLEVLLQGECLEHHAIPFVLQGNKQARDAGRGDGLRLHNGLGWGITSDRSDTYS